MTDLFQETSSILDNLFLVDVRVGFPCGTVSGSDDLVNSNDKEIVRVGVQIFDPKLQRPFSAARQKVRRICTSLGSSFLGGYAIPEGHIEEFRREVATLSESFLASQKKFMDTLAEANRQWADNHPDLRSVILANCPTASQAEKSFKFAVRMCRVLAPEPGSVADTKDNFLFEEVRGLGGQIAKEIAQDVADSWGGDVGTGKTTQKVVGLIRRCRKKAHGLAFVHPKVAALVSTIDQVLSELPASGPIDGVQYLKVVGLLRMLSDPNQILGDQQVIFEEPSTESEPDPVDDASSSQENKDDVDAHVVIPPAIKPQPSTLKVGWMMF